MRSVNEQTDGVMNRKPNRHNGKNNRFDVYEFPDGDDIGLKEPKKIVGNQKPRRNNTSPVDKGKFLQCFVGGTTSRQKETSRKQIDVEDFYGTKAPMKNKLCKLPLVRPSAKAVVGRSALIRRKGITNELINIDAEVDEGPMRKMKERGNELIDIDAEVPQGTMILQTHANNKLIDLDSEVARVTELANGANRQAYNIDAELVCNALLILIIAARGTNALQKESSSKLLKAEPHLAGSQSKVHISGPLDVSSKYGDLMEEIYGFDAVESGSLNYEKEPISIISDEELDSSERSYSSTSTSHLPGKKVSEENQILDGGFSQQEIDTKDMKVVVSADFLRHRDIYSTKSCLMFFCSGIKVEGVKEGDTKEKFMFELALEDVICIQCEWCAQVETAFFRLLLKSKDSGEDGNTKDSGIEEFNFSVYDHHWPEREGEIKSLDIRYKDLWDMVHEERDGCTRMGQISAPYFSDFGKPFEDIIYPRGDPDAVSISKRDVELLKPETFINDTIVDFYIKYLKLKIQPEEQHRYHFFNCFFFRKLADLEKDPSGACKGTKAFQRVRKWTRKVNLFEKDYIFIPVNYSLHWSLIVICHPGEVVRFKDDEIENSPKVPCILHMDSIRGSHRGLKSLFQSYLYEEWKERYMEATDDVLTKFLNLQFIPLQLPQQENWYDCGLFLLHYVECFLKQAPLTFNPFHIINSSNFLNENWFPPAEASHKRWLIYKILEEEINHINLAEYPEENERESDVELLKEVCWSKETCTGLSLSGASSPSIVQKNICRSEDTCTEIVPLAAYSPRVVQSKGRPIVTSMKLSEPGLNGQSSFAGKCPQKNMMSPIEEVEETSATSPVSHREPLVLSIEFKPSNPSPIQQGPLFSFSDERDKKELVSLSSSNESGDSYTFLTKKCKPRFPLTPNGLLMLEDSDDAVVEDFNDAVVEDSEGEIQDSASSLHEDVIILTPQHNNLAEGGCVRDKDVVSERLTAKRQRYSSPVRIEDD